MNFNRFVIMKNLFHFACQVYTLKCREWSWCVPFKLIKPNYHSKCSKLWKSIKSYSFGFIIFVCSKRVIWLGFLKPVKSYAWMKKFRFVFLLWVVVWPFFCRFWVWILKPKLEKWIKRFDAYSFNQMIIIRGDKKLQIIFPYFFLLLYFLFFPSFCVVLVVLLY